MTMNCASLHFYIFQFSELIHLNIRGKPRGSWDKLRNLCKTYEKCLIFDLEGGLNVALSMESINSCITITAFGHSTIYYTIKLEYKVFQVCTTTHGLKLKSFNGSNSAQTTLWELIMLPQTLSRTKLDVRVCQAVSMPHFLGPWPLRYI